MLFTLRKYFKNKNKFLINGIRISIAGKWKKTGSGRKQRLTINIGRLNIQTMNSFIDYDFQNVSTKFGCFSLKTLISYKSIY